MRGYGRDYGDEWGYPARRIWRGEPGYDAGYRRMPEPRFGRERGYRGDLYGRDYARDHARTPRGYRPPRYEREYSRAYRDLFGAPHDLMGGMGLAYRETQGRTRPHGIGDGGIGGADSLGTGGGFFHI